MDPVSNVDRLVFLLRQRLLERSKAAERSGRRPAPSARPPVGGMESVQALAAVDSVDDRQLRRALVQNFLAEQFGPALINEAKFQQVVDRVAEALEGDAASAKLLNRVTSELRASAR